MKTAPGVLVEELPSEASELDTPPEQVSAYSWYRAVGSVPFFVIHVLAVWGAIHVGATPGLVALCLATYALRMFFITAGYHRYLAHRAFKTSRFFQLVLATGGTLAAQKGPLWWAGHHRNHHRYSDGPRDVHSPVQRGFWWSHMLWILSGRFDATPFHGIKDFARFPELVWLEHHWLVPPLAGSLALWLAGGLPWLVWGGLVSTVLLWHGTFTINSLSHVFGKRRYETSDASRNNVWLALLTFGEGWHNNHHRYQSSANQGFFWYELDVSYEILRLLSRLGLVWDLRLPPAAVLDEGLANERPRAPVPLPIAGRV